MNNKESFIKNDGEICNFRTARSNSADKEVERSSKNPTCICNNQETSELEAINYLEQMESAQTIIIDTQASFLDKISDMKRRRNLPFNRFKKWVVSKFK
ncbi:hypothetical protein D5R81_08460 [Parashewanella spongiae]|uniref:Uncharacterized protein n=1 Tax=Parashewanella spongiae TaxID=342950 RepID=A0A3A6TWQ0_9GAMM|nr:hypothetical protein [Parashewanella spongiae]MCL1078022.1 hypothetical protein [Parashewanella spongiae]RJY17458.1 hypothetical protein D5R81_08460 [Parashewanella spongiae]